MTVEQLINVLTAFKPDTEIHARLVGNFEYRAKLEQLIKDANEKYIDKCHLPAGTQFKETDSAYYMGMRDGLKRALNVIEGKG